MCRELNDMKSGGCYLNLFADVLQFFSADETLLTVFNPNHKALRVKSTLYTGHFTLLSKCAAFISCYNFFFFFFQCNRLH